MNQLTQSLAHLCEAHLYEEKWLIAPSLRTGYQWLDSVTRSGRPILNVHVKTLVSTAIDLASVEMAARGITLVSGRAGGLFIDRILREQLKGHLKYLDQVEPSARLAEVILSSINAVRLADLSVEDLEREKFEVSLKGEDMVLIIDEYRKLLGAEKMIDYADMLNLAIDRLSSDNGCLGPETMVFIPDYLDVTRLERNFLKSIPEDRCRVLTSEVLPGGELTSEELPGVKLAGDGPPGEVPPGREPSAKRSPDPSTSLEAVTSDLELLRWILSPAAAPEAPSDGSVRITRAVGEVNEVRGVLRYCIVNETPWDEVELLHTDAAIFVPLVYETFMTIDHSLNGSIDDLPVTFREGLPCRYSRPGQALATWLQWVQGRYPQALLVKMVREGLLEIQDKEGEHAGFTRLAVLLRGVGIGFGRERYLPKISERIEGLENRKKNIERIQDGDEADEEYTPAQLEYIERDIRDLKVLMDLVSNLMECALDEGMSQREIVTQAKRFIETATRCINPLDHNARHRIVEDMADMEYWLSREDRDTGIDIWEWLESLVSSARVMGSGPRPGCIHVDSIYSGGHSGRPHTFIVGLDDSRFPGGGMQDPLLLDSERARLSTEIPTAARQLEKKMENFARLLARLRGRVTMSFSSRNLLEDRDMFPSPVLLAVYRLLTGDTEGDQQRFLQWLPPPVSFAPAEPEGCLDGVEWWLWRLTGPEMVRDPEKLVHDRFPHLAWGRRAATLQDSPEFTAYDGHVPHAGEDLDPTTESGPVMSSSRLQTIGRCPRAFFFQYGLEIVPPEDLVVDPRRWLDPLARGSMLHELFEQFFRGLVEAGRLPNYERDREELSRLLREKVKAYKEAFPPPSDSVFRGEMDRIERVVDTFLREEELYFARNDCAPVFLETSLGLPTEGHKSSLDRDEPIGVELPGGKTIRVRGRVDRIDQGSSSGGQYCIWDYKAGKGSWGYEKADPFRQGRRVQSYLYLEMVSRCLRESVSPEARVATFGFFFPGERSVGERMTWTPCELGDGGRIVELLCRTVINGVFAATDKWMEDCRFCDYRSICGDLESVAAFSELKLKNKENSMLEPFRELRGHGD